MRKVFATVAIVLMLMPSASSAATLAELEAQRLALMEQLIVLLQARVAELLALRDAQGLVLGVSTSTVSTASTASSSTEVVKKKRKSGGGGGGRSNNVVPPVETPTPVPTTTPTTTPEEDLEPGATIEELQQMILQLSDMVNVLLAEDGKTFGTCEWVTTSEEVNRENLQIQINQLLSVVAALASGSTTANGCPLLDDPDFSLLNARLRFVASDENPDPYYILAMNEEIIEDVHLFDYVIRSEKGVIAPDTLFVRLETSGGSSIADLVSATKLQIGEKQFEGEIYSSDHYAAVYRFAVNGNVTLFEGDEAHVRLLADIVPLVEYEQIKPIMGSVPHELVDMTTASSGTSILTSDELVGSVSGNVHLITTSGVHLEIVDTYADVAEGTPGEFTVEFDVLPIAGNYYVEQSASQGEEVVSGFQYVIENGASDVVAIVDSTADEESSGIFALQDGEIETFTLNTEVQVETEGEYRMCLIGLYYSSNVDGVTNSEFAEAGPFSDFCTNWIVIQPQ